MTQLLNEGAQNIEDLDVKAFIAAVRRIGQMQASERLDGSGIWVGIDESGRLYTSRPNDTEKFYSDSDYPYFAANNGLRAAHAAFARKEKDIRAALSPGEAVEAEILYGRQPNAITYGLDGKNFLAFTRGVGSTNDFKVEQLSNFLENQTVQVKVIIVDTPDGINLEREGVTQTFQFVGPQKIQPDLLQKVKVEKELKKLEAYLEKDSGINNLSNFELMSTSLGSIPKEEREQAKAVKDQVIATVKNQHKLTIKKELIDQVVSKVKPKLAAGDLSGDEDLGLEGVFLKDPETGETYSLVNKSGFSSVNAFNYAIRNQIAGMVRTTDDTASLEARGGITGQMKIRIAELLGNKDLALGREAKKIFADNRGDNPTQTLRNVAKTLNGAQDFNGVKRKIQAVVAATIDELQHMLDEFKKHKDNPETAYRLKLKNGKTIGLSPEVVQRTLVSFAEARRNLKELYENTGKAGSFDQLIATLYGRAAKAVHKDQTDELAESLILEDHTTLAEKRNYTDTARWGVIKDPIELINCYLATVLTAFVIYKHEDKRGIRLLKDKAHYRMQKYETDMSAVNFWGMAVWHPKSKDVMAAIPKAMVAAIDRITKKVPEQWTKYLHMDLSFAGELPIDWHDHYETLKRLIQFSVGLYMERVQTLLDGAYKYQELSHDEKVKFLPKLYFYLQQYVPTSPLLTRLRAIQHEVLGGDDMAVTAGQRLLGEDGEIAAGPGAAPVATTGAMTGAPTGSAPSTSTSANGIADLPIRLGNNKRTVMRRRNPEVKRKRFERPKDSQ